MLGSDYDGDSEYASTRLVGTCVTYKGEPVYVADQTSSGRYHVQGLTEERESHTVSLNSLDLSPYSLGYVNFKTAASYISRKPMRRDWKQGLRKQNIVSSFGYHSSDLPLHSLIPTIKNEFPTYQECLDRLRASESGDKKLHSIAWHRNWAVQAEELKVLHRFGKEVGNIIDGTPVLYDRYNHLQEQLEESLNADD